MLIILNYIPQTYKECKSTNQWSATGLLCLRALDREKSLLITSKILPYVTHRRLTEASAISALWEENQAS